MKYGIIVLGFILIGIIMVLIIGYIGGNVDIKHGTSSLSFKSEGFLKINQENKE